MSRKHLYWFFLFLLSVFFLIAVAWIVSAREETTFKEPIVLEYCPNTAKEALLMPIGADSLLKQFPYETYLCNGQFKTFVQLQKDIRDIGVLYPDLPDAGQYLVATAMTEKLFYLNRQTFDVYRPDSLLAYLEYAEQMRSWSLADSVNGVAYDVVFQFWFEKIAQLLSHYHEKNKDLRRDFTFRYLDTKLGRYRFLTNLRESRIEKFMYNLRSGNWTHLVSATWNDLSTAGKVLLTLLSTLTVYAYFYLFIGLFENLKKRVLGKS